MKTLVCLPRFFLMPRIGCRTMWFSINVCFLFGVNHMLYQSSPRSRFRSWIILLIIGGTLPFATGCLEVDLELPVVTQVAVIEGDPILAKANATLFKGIEPFVVQDQLESSKGFKSFHLDSFLIQLTDDELSGPSDQDDLYFIDYYSIVIRATDADCELDPEQIAAFDRTVTTSTMAEIRFEVNREVELLPYLKCGFELVSDMKGRVPPDNVSIEGVAVFVMTPRS